jgi:hypothetical protein
VTFCTVAVPTAVCAVAPDTSSIQITRCLRRVIIIFLQHSLALRLSPALLLHTFTKHMPGQTAGCGSFEPSIHRRFRRDGTGSNSHCCRHIP